MCTILVDKFINNSLEVLMFPKTVKQKVRNDNSLLVVCTIFAWVLLALLVVENRKEQILGRHLPSEVQKCFVQKKEFSDHKRWECAPIAYATYFQKETEK